MTGIFKNIDDLSSNYFDSLNGMVKFLSSLSNEIASSSSGVGTNSLSSIFTGDLCSAFPNDQVCGSTNNSLRGVVG